MDQEDRPMQTAETIAKDGPAVLPAGQHPTAAEAVGAIRNFSQFIVMAEDGQLNADLSDALREIGQNLRDYVNAYGGKPTAGLTVKFKFKMDDGVVDIRAEFATTLPKVNRARTIAWTTAAGDFSPQNPRQMTLFPPGPVGPVRTV